MPKVFEKVGFDRFPSLQLVTHKFTSNENGELLHFINDELRATVPPEGWSDYEIEWPDSVVIINDLYGVKKNEDVS